MKTFVFLVMIVCLIEVVETWGPMRRGNLPVRTPGAWASRAAAMFFLGGWAFWLLASGGVKW